MASNLRQKSASSGSTRPRGANNPRYAARSGTQARAKAPRPSAKTTPRVRQPEVTSVRIGDIDRLEKEHARQTRTSKNAKPSKRSARTRRGPFAIVGVIAALLVAVVIAIAVLPRTGLFVIENVEVTGADHLTKAEVSQLISVPQGSTLLNVDVDGIKDGLMRDAWVQSVTVNRVFPSTLQIVVTEREIAAVVSIPMGQTQTLQDWAIAADGMWLMAIPSKDSEVGKLINPQIYTDAEEVLRITDVPYGVTPQIGAYCTDDNINNALSIVSGMTTELADQVKTVSATDPESTLLTLDNNIEIAFGTADNIRDKERVCLEIIKQNPKVVYINVRVVDRPTWRAV